METNVYIKKHSSPTFFAELLCNITLKKVVFYFHLLNRNASHATLFCGANIHGLQNHHV